MEILRKHSPSPGLFDRRGFLTRAGATLAYTALAPYAFPRVASAQHLGSYPFTLGVASGDPTPDGVVLWTRLAPRPLTGGGMPGHPIAVQWRVALDERMTRSFNVARCSRFLSLATRSTSKWRGWTHLTGTGTGFGRP